MCVCVRLNSSCCMWSEPSGWRWRERERCDTPMMIQHSCNLQVICICVLLTSPVVAIYKTHTHNNETAPERAEHMRPHSCIFSQWLNSQQWRRREINMRIMTETRRRTNKWLCLEIVFSQTQWLIIMFQRTCRLRPWCSARGVWRPDFSHQGRAFLVMLTSAPPQKSTVAIGSYWESTEVCSWENHL